MIGDGGSLMTSSHAMDALAVVFYHLLLPSLSHSLAVLHCCCREVYDLLSPGFSGRCTAPLLVDKKAWKAVCNESAFITRNLAELSLPPGTPPGSISMAPVSRAGAIDLYPQALRSEIDRWNDKIYDAGMPARLPACVHLIFIMTPPPSLYSWLLPIFPFCCTLCCSQQRCIQVRV